MSKILFDLLLKIHLYYPIGLPQYAGEFPGFKLFQEKISAKIDNITNNIKTPWMKFIADIESDSAEFRVLDYSYFQFPNYVAIIQLEKSKNQECEFVKELVVNISLLADYYTIYFRDSYRYFNYLDDYDSNPSIQFLYFKSCKEKKYIDLAKKIENKLLNIFSTFKYADHLFLLNTEIEGAQIYRQNPGIGNSQKFSIYEFLFDDNINRENLRILK